jgi:hypothetical protein
LHGRPALDLGTEPKLDSAVTEIDHRPWHVFIPALVEADAVAVGNAEKISDRLGVKQIFRRDLGTHVA